MKAVKQTSPNPNTSLQKSCYRQKVTREVGPADTAPVGKTATIRATKHSIKMVNKGKLKMALVAEKQIDFKQEHLKKMAKKARKEKKAKQPVAVVADEKEGEDEEEEEEEEDEEGIRELMELDEKENGDEYRRTEVNNVNTVA